MSGLGGFARHPASMGIHFFLGRICFVSRRFPRAEFFLRSPEDEMKKTKVVAKAGQTVVSFGL